MIYKSKLVVVCCILSLLCVILLLRMRDTITQPHVKFQAVPIDVKPIPDFVPAPPTKRPPIPGDDELQLLKDADLEELYYMYAENIEEMCVKKVRLGSADDGGWDLCDDPAYRPRQPCTIYSFGINNDFTFDDDVGARYGCTVHAFDPSMSTKDHQRSQRVFFHDIGIADYNGVNEKGWQLLTLTAIKEKYNHTKIDVLKVDIEQMELSTFPQIIASGELKNVVQLVFEIHIHLDKNKVQDRSIFLKGLQILRALHEQGFRIFYSHRNHWCAHISRWSGRSWIGCHEIFMVNVRAKQL